MERSCFRKTAEYPVGISTLGKVVVVHVGDRQIVLDTPHLARNYTECPPGLFVQIHNENWLLSVGKSLHVSDERDGVVSTLVALRRKRDKFVKGQRVEGQIADAYEACLESLFVWLLNGFTKRNPCRVIGKVRSQ